MDEKQGVEDDGLSQGDRPDGVHEDRGKGSRIATHGGCHAQTGKTDADADTHSRKADVNASSDFC